MSVLITKPRYDDTTAYLSEWSKEVTDDCKSRGIKILEVENENVDKITVENFIKSQNPTFLVFNGHGDPETIYGQHNKPLLSVEDLDKDVVSEKIIHSFSCSSASILGPECINAGCKTFIGYDNEFIFIIDTTRSTQPLKDESAKPFLESANQVVISIIKGNEIGEAFEMSQAKYDKWIEYYNAHYPEEAPHILPWLIWDKIHQVILGQKNFKVY